MSKPKVKSLVALVCGSGKIVFSFLLRHCVPLLISVRIHPHIEELRTDEDKDVVHTNGNKDPVSTAVERFIIVPVDLLPVSLALGHWGGKIATHITCDDRRSLN